jgi:hypothetical protein
VGTALGEPSTADCSSCCSLVASVATTVAIVAPRPANGARAKVVPRFFASGTQEGARGWSSAKRSAAAAEARGAVPDVPDAQGVRTCPGSDRRLQHAPFALGDDDERVTRGLRIEGLAAAAASTFFSRGSLSLLDRLPPPPSSARTARTCVRSRTTCTVRAARRAGVGLAGTAGGEQRCRTACLAHASRKFEV